MTTATHLTRASQELFRRTPDECFASFGDLRRHCEMQRSASQDRWHLPQDLVLSSEMTLCAGHDGAELRLNDWSSSQLCRNHIVWDAVEVVDFKRKHTANARGGLDEIRRIIERLIERHRKF